MKLGMGLILKRGSIQGVQSTLNGLYLFGVFVFVQVSNVTRYIHY